MGNANATARPMKGITMSRMLRLFQWQVSTEQWDIRFGQIACWAFAIAILMCGYSAVIRFATSEFEIMIGLVAVSCLAMQTVIIGMVMPLVTEHVTGQIKRNS